MKTKKLILVILTLMLVNIVYTQSVQYNEFYELKENANFAEKSKFIITADENTIVSFYDKLFKLNSDGDLLWTKANLPTTYYKSRNNIVIYDDESFILVKESNILRINNDGEILWNINFSDCYFEAVTVYNGMIYLAGQSKTTAYALELLKIDANGNILLKKEFITRAELNYNDWELSYMTPSSDGNLIIIGSCNIYYSLHDADMNPCLIKFTADCDTLWTKRHINSEMMGGEYIAEGSDSCLYYNGTSNYFPIIKCDKDGNKVWVKNHYPFTDPTSFMKLANDNFMAVYKITDTTYYSEIDTSGNILSTKVLLRPNPNYASRIFYSKISESGDLYSLGYNKYSDKSTLFILIQDKRTFSAILKNTDFCMPNKNDTAIVQIAVDTLYSKSNVFTLQLSDSSVFTNPINIVSTDTSSSFEWKVPLSEILKYNKQKNYLRVSTSDYPDYHSNLIKLNLINVPNYDQLSYYSKWDTLMTDSDYHCLRSNENMLVVLSKNVDYTPSGLETFEYNFDSIQNSRQNADTSIEVNYSKTGCWGLSVIIDNQGCRDTIFDTVDIRIAPNFNLVLTPDEDCKNYAGISVTGNSISNLDYEWDWNSAIIDSGSNIGHYKIHYDYEGYYPVGLTVTDSSGCQNQKVVYSDLYDYLNLVQINPRINFSDQNQPVINFFTDPYSNDSVYILKTNKIDTILLFKNKSSDFVGNSMGNFYLCSYTDSATFDSTMYYEVYRKDLCGLRSVDNLSKPIYLTSKTVDGQINLSWNDYEGFLSFNYMTKSFDPIFSSDYYLLKGTSVNSLSIDSDKNPEETDDIWNLTFPVESDTMYYRVKANIDNLIYSNVLVVIQAHTENIEQLVPKNIYITNNPDGQFTIHFGEDNSQFNNLMIINTLGQTICSQELNGEQEVVFDISKFPSGVYHAILKNNKVIKTLKFINNSY